jgi:hypothetical protein
VPLLVEAANECLHLFEAGGFNFLIAQLEIVPGFEAYFHTHLME